MPIVESPPTRIFKGQHIAFRASVLYRGPAQMLVAKTYIAPTDAGIPSNPVGVVGLGGPYTNSFRVEHSDTLALQQIPETQWLSTFPWEDPGLYDVLWVLGFASRIFIGPFLWHEEAPIKRRYIRAYEVS